MAEEKLSQPVERIMRAPPLTAQFSDNVSTIVDRMVTYDVGCCIIMSGGGPVGIVTERDILERVIKSGKEPSKTLAQDVMSSPVLTIDNNKPVSHALKMMRDKNVRRLAVVKGGKIVGIVTERRILDSLAP
ncbi:MAG: CBS domain-containing protein [Candidatus Brockarchaeota archaeon]|nr:CBS domain-containing protein [Candidatus Brockarchaeota archaeon]